MGKLFLNAVNLVTRMNMLCDATMSNACIMSECNMHALTLFDFYAYSC